MVARYGYDGLSRGVERGIDEQSLVDPNGVDAYQHFFYNSRWQVADPR